MSIRRASSSALERFASPITVSFRDIEIGEKASIRDLWAHKELGVFEGSFTATVPSHGVVLVEVRVLFNLIKIDILFLTTPQGLSLNAVITGNDGWGAAPISPNPGMPFNSWQEISDVTEE